MFDRFTDHACKVMALARQEAQRYNHDYIGAEHLLLGIIAEGSGVAHDTLRNLDVDLSCIRAEVDERVSDGSATANMRHMPFTPVAKKILEFSLEEASNFGHNYIGTEHLLLGLLRMKKVRSFWNRLMSWSKICIHATFALKRCRCSSMIPSAPFVVILMSKC